MAERLIHAFEALDADMSREALDPPKLNDDDQVCGLEHPLFLGLEEILVTSSTSLDKKSEAGCNTVEARFSGHRFSGKPRFKGHSSKNLSNNFCFFVRKSARNSGKSRFSGQKVCC